MVIGLFLTANFLAPTAIPVIPEMQEATQDRFPNFDAQYAGNYHGALFSTFFGLGQVAGPLFGASTYAALNFRLTEDIMALIFIVFAIFYFFCASGKTAIKDTFKRKHQEIILKDQIIVHNLDSKRTELLSV